MKKIYFILLLCVFLTVAISCNKTEQINDDSLSEFASEKAITSEETDEKDSAQGLRIDELNTQRTDSTISDTEMNPSP